MSLPPTEETAIHVFAEGASVELLTQTFQGLTYVDRTIPFERQSAELIALVNNLAKTVNKNAYCLKTLIDATSKRPDALPQRTFAAFLEQTNSLLLPRASKSDALTSFVNREVGGLSAADQIQHQIDFNKHLLTELLADLDSLRAKVTQQEAGLAAQGQKLSALESETKTTREETDQKIKNIASSLDLRVTAIAESERTLKDKVQALNAMVLESENRIKTELKFITQKLNDGVKLISSQTEIAKSPSGSRTEVLSRYLEITDFRKYQELQKEITDSLDDRLSRFNLTEILAELERKQTELFQMLQQTASRKSFADNLPPRQTNDGRLSIWGGATTGEKKADPGPRPSRGSILNQSECLREIEEKVNEIERTLNKKVIGMDARLKEVEDVKKLSKLMTRIQMELNLKINKEIFDSEIETKLSRTEFFDFVNKNLITLDKLKTVELQITNLGTRLDARVDDLEKKVRRLKAQVKAISDSNETASLKNGEWMKDNESQLAKTGDSLSDLRTKLAALSKDFSDTRKEIFELVTARIHSLATTKPVLCLSCGARDINYPPLELQGQGVGGGMFFVNGTVQDQNSDPNQEEPERKPSKAFVISKPRMQTGRSSWTKLTADQGIKTEDGSTRHPDESKCPHHTQPNPRAAGSKGHPLSGVTSSYTTGMQVFNRNVIVEEHTHQRHDPVSQLVESNALRREKARPYSSIPARSKIKGLNPH